MVWLVLALVVVVIAVVVAVTGSDRYRTRVRPEFTMPTTEVHVDPENGVRQRVYVNPATGERAYVDEPAPLYGGPPPLERPGLIGGGGPGPWPPPSLPPGPPPQR